GGFTAPAGAAAGLVGSAAGAAAGFVGSAALAGAAVGGTAVGGAPPQAAMAAAAAEVTSVPISVRRDRRKRDMSYSLHIQPGAENTPGARDGSILPAGEQTSKYPRKRFDTLSRRHWNCLPASRFLL